MTHTLTPLLIRAARGLLGWTRTDLAQRAGLSVAGLAQIERGATKPYPASLSRIRSAIEEGGVIFIFGCLLGVRLKGARTGEPSLLSHRIPMPGQIRAARMLLGWTQEDLRHRVKLSVPTMIRVEKEGAIPRPATLKAIREVFEGAGIEFLEGVEPGVRIRIRMVRRSAVQPGSEKRGS